MRIPAFFRRRRAALLALIGLVALAGTASGVVLATSAAAHPWWYASGGSMCGIPAFYRVDGGGRQALGDCAENLVVPPVVAKVRVGQEVDVHITTIMPIPITSNPQVLQQMGVADQDSTVSFRAVGDGTVELITHTAFCLPVTASGMPLVPSGAKVACPVLKVIVGGAGGG